MSSAPVLRRSLVAGGIVALVVGGVAALLGGLLSGGAGVVAAVLAAVVSALFLGLTAASMLLGGRLAHGDGTHPVFWGVVLGGWLVKLLVFVGLLIALRTVSWLDPTVFGLTLVAVVTLTLVSDVVVLARARIPIDEHLRRRPPGAPASPPPAAGDPRTGE
ncbi:MAG: hypothetical protein J0G30_08295 [Actinomycetales bacterium]|nr:hypothetical protein [Actinomycetales bacterium]